MSRVDNIKRKPTKNNVIDLEFHKSSFKYDNSSKPYNDDSWKVIPDGNSKRYIHIDRISSEEHFNSQLDFIKDYRFFVHSELKFFSHDTLLKFTRMMSFFVEFCNENLQLNLNGFSDINYSVLSQYGNYLITQENAKNKYSNLLRILKKVSKYKNIEINEDIKNQKFPKINLKQKKNKIIHYTEQEFDLIAKTVINIISDYIKNPNGDIDEATFVKTSYWFIAICSGLNKTAMDTLTIDSLTLLKEDEKFKTYIYAGLKNRSTDGYQSGVIKIQNEENHIFETVLNTLKQLNIKNCDFIKPELKNSLFCYKASEKSNGKHCVYNGEGSSLTITNAYIEYAKKFNSEHLRLSTLKIRNQWSLKMFDLSKSEAQVSRMLGHASGKTVETSYLRRDISPELQAKFAIVQDLISSFSKHESINDWVKFQKAYNISDDNIAEVIKNLKEGKYNNNLGTCINKEDSNVCNSYLNCFSCENFSIVGEKDAWKLLSFRNAVIEEQKHRNTDYQWLINNIDEIFKCFNRELIINARTKFRKCSHPFWKNRIMIKTIMDEHEDKS